MKDCLHKIMHTPGIDIIISALTCLDGVNLFLVYDGTSDAMRLIKVSVNGNIEFSEILKNGYCDFGSIIENSDSSYATTLISGDSVYVDKINNIGKILVKTEEIIYPTGFSLFQNFPNPLNPTTTISYDMPEAQNITLQIFDITGQLVETLYNGYKEAGHWDITWNAANHSSGIYIYRLTYGDRSVSRKMVVLK